MDWRMCRSFVSTATGPSMTAMRISFATSAALSCSCLKFYLKFCQEVGILTIVTTTVPILLEQQLMVTSCPVA